MNEREIVKAATPGPWRWGEARRSKRTKATLPRNLIAKAGNWILHPSQDGGVHANWESDAAFIAHFNPTRVAELLDTLDRYREALENADRAFDVAIAMENTTAVVPPGMIVNLVTVAGHAQEIVRSALSAAATVKES